MTTENNAQNRKRKFFHKTDFVKMGGTVLVTLLALYLFNGFSKKCQTDSSFMSIDISANKMLRLHKDYMDFEPLDLRYKDSPTDQDYKYDKLRGFRFSADDLDAIINNNRIVDKVTGKPIRPKEVMFFLGQEGKWKDPATKRDRPEMRIIAIGMKSDETLMMPENKSDYNDKTKASIYDKADPCPGSGCPPPLPEPQ